MSKKIKRLMALLLSAMMLLSLAACGESGSGSGSGNNSELSEVDKIGEYFSDYEAFDLGGRTIKIAVFYDSYYDSFDTKPEDNPGVQDLERGQLMIDNVKRIEKKYNCKIEYVNPGGEAIKSSLNTSVLNGTPDYDVYLVQMDFALPLAVNGYFYDLSDFKADYLDINNDQNIITGHEIAGTNCFFFKSGIDVAATYLAYNADMIKEAGLEDPNELYARGEWTWEKFAEYCTKLTKDTDNNGQTDIYGYGGDLTYTIQEFLASNDAILVNEDGTEGLSDPKVLETFKFLGELYGEKKIAKPVVDDWYEGLHMWMNNQTVFGPTKMWVLQTEGRTINFDYRIVPYPVGPSGTGEQAGQSFGDYFVIPRGVKDPEKVYQVLEEFFGFYCDDFDYRDEDMLALVEGCFVEEADIETSVEIGTWGNGDVWTIIDKDFLINSIFSGVVSGEATPAESVESHKQLFQDEIDAIFNP
jgi:ABC-type glycerol-3-phosphate transport system substrate-binding protein